MEWNSSPLKNRLLKWLCAEYEEHLNPEMWRAHLYVGVGLGGFLLIILLPSLPSDVAMGLILAATVFSFHEYLEQHIRYLLNFISSRCDFCFPTLGTSSPLIYGIIVLIDLIIAVPMFGYSMYSNFIASFILLIFGCWFMAMTCISMAREVEEKSLFNHSSPLYVGLGWIGLLLAALIYILLHQSDFWVFINLTFGIRSYDSLPISSISFLLIGLSILIVDITLLVLIYVIIVPIIVAIFFVFCIILPPYILFFQPQLLGEGFEQMSQILRLWAGISILIIYIILSAPRLLSWIDQT